MVGTPSSSSPSSRHAAVALLLGAAAVCAGCAAGPAGPARAAGADEGAPVPSLSDIAGTWCTGAGTVDAMQVVLHDDGSFELLHPAFETTGRAALDPDGRTLTAQFDDPDVPEERFRLRLEKEGRSVTLLFLDEDRFVPGACSGLPSAPQQDAPAEDAHAPGVGQRPASSRGAALPA